MDKSDFEAGFKEMMAAFRINNLCQETCDVYFKYLKHASREKYKDAVETVVIEDKFFPTISRLRELLPNERAVW